VKGGSWTYRQIVQGLIDNFLGREAEWRWRLNDEVPVPKDAHPLKNPGLELTGPWHPLDMAFNALNSPAPMNMPDFEDAAPALAARRPISR
jgi:malate synthase